MAHNSRFHLYSAALMFVFFMTFTTALPAQSKVIYLWPEGAPGSEHWTQKETEYMFGPWKEVRNVTKPSITL